MFRVVPVSLTGHQCLLAIQRDADPISAITCSTSACASTAGGGEHGARGDI